MSRRRKRRGEAKLGGLVAAVFIIGAVAVAIAAMFYWNWSNGRAQALIDPVTLCPKKGPSSILAVLIDRTDGLNEIQAEALRRRLAMWSKSVPKHGAFKIYEVGGSGLLKPIVSVCNPGDGSDLSQIDANPKMWAKKYREKFQGPINNMIDGMRFDTKADQSPIFEAIQAISVENFGPDSTAVEHKLIIVTDLLQYVPKFNLYRGVPDVNAFRETAYGMSVSSNLSDVEVEVDLLHRISEEGHQTDALGTFWLQWLRSQGAMIEKFTQIPG